MYSLSQVQRGVRRGLSNPSFFGRELNRLYHRRLYRRPYNTDGVDVVAEDWDTLLLLDACRYDMFRRIHALPGRLEARESKGSHTSEFLAANFGGRTLRDTVYVTASPQLYRRRDELDVEFHDVVNVWREAGWDEDHGTVRPETMAEHVRRAVEEYPQKRIIGHFLQPHYPFLDADDRLNARRFGDDEGAADVWGELMRGRLDATGEEVWRAYVRNLTAVLPVIEELLAELDGRTVVTADHGNMVGERASPVPIREWGHPPGVYTDQLVRVPWLVYEHGPRREITEGTAEGAADAVADDVVEDRLRQLGYAD
ncbi:alkaline phosphatase family protein [Halostella litorea]|uniref:hypothetical protein n=1 Tax=Halostella litorea TaxID=2528831 RepID=UPI0010931690|nr:hypothetical protein [Halostella litorea]